MSNSITVSSRPQMVYRLKAVRRGPSGEVLGSRESADIPNVFTNFGVEQLFAAPNSGNPASISVGVGTGSSAPAVTDLRLDNFLAGRYESGINSGSFTNNGDGTGYWQYHKVTVFPVGAATGNISEVGGYLSSSHPTSTDDLASRALVVDGNGDPTVFEVLADEELELTVYFRLHFSLEDIVLEDVPITGDGPPQKITIRPFNVNSATTWPRPMSTNGLYGRACWGEYYNLPAITDSQGSHGGAGSGQANTSQGTQAILGTYVPGSKQKEFALRRRTGNVENVVGFEFSPPGMVRYAVKLEPGIPKSDLHRATFSLIYKIDNTP